MKLRVWGCCCAGNEKAEPSNPAPPNVQFGWSVAPMLVGKARRAQLRAQHTNTRAHAHKHTRLLGTHCVLAIVMADEVLGIKF
jgi:hypothetical protein